jgi:ribosomal protein L27
MQKPIVNKGTVFPAGTVVAIKKDHVLLDTNDGIKSFTFSQIERFINVKRSLSQA